MKSECPLCKMIDEKTLNSIYDENGVIAFLSDTPSAEGHVIVMPKEHYPIIELVPDFVVAKVFVAVNKLSTQIFDAMNIQGTNIIVNNGVAAGQQIAHFMVHIIPRKEKDGLDFSWNPKQLNEEEMATVELSLKEETSGIGQFEEEHNKPISLDEHSNHDTQHKHAGHGNKHDSHQDKGHDNQESHGAHGHDSHGHGHSEHAENEIHFDPFKRTP